MTRHYLNQWDAVIAGGRRNDDRYGREAKEGEEVQ